MRTPVISTRRLRQRVLFPIFSMLAVEAFGAGGGQAAAQVVTGSRIEDRVSLYGGYLPPGGFPSYSGAPLGGYTPWGYQGREGGWLKLHYGDGYVVFDRSYSFGEEAVGGPRSLVTSYFPTEYHPHPLEYGRGPWNSYGAARVNSRADIWKRQGAYGRIPPP